MEKTRIKYNDLIEEKEELQEIENWLDKIQKKIIKIEKITFIISGLMTVPFLLYGFCIFPNTLIHFEPMIPLAIYGAGGILMTGTAIITLNPILSLMKLIYKNSLKNTNQKISALEKTMAKSRNQENKKTDSKPKSQITTPKYSYKPIQKSKTKSSVTITNKPNQTANKNTEFDPKDHIKIINGKLVWIDNPKTINNPKKRKLSK